MSYDADTNAVCWKTIPLFHFYIVGEGCWSLGPSFGVFGAGYQGALCFILFFLKRDWALCCTIVHVWKQIIGLVKGFGLFDLPF